jgi:hypothetical protein
VPLRNDERGMRCPDDTWARITKALRQAIEDVTA